MKKKLLIIILLALVLVGCGKKEEQKESEEGIKVQEEQNLEYKENIRITINKKEYTLKLLDNPATNKLRKMLPLEMEMEELNGNEKYIFLGEEFPTNESTPKRIEAGDVMLYGNNCLVIFYKSFDSKGYSYTKIGHIDSLEDLGKGSVKVKISE